MGEESADCRTDATQSAMTEDARIFNRLSDAVEELAGFNLQDHELYRLWFEPSHSSRVPFPRTLPVSLTFCYVARDYRHQIAWPLKASVISGSSQCNQDAKG